AAEEDAVRSFTLVLSVPSNTKQACLVGLAALSCMPRTVVWLAILWLMLHSVTKSYGRKSPVLSSLVVLPLVVPDDRESREEATPMEPAPVVVFQLDITPVADAVVPWYAEVKNSEELLAA